MIPYNTLYGDNTLHYVEELLQTNNENFPTMMSLQSAAYCRIIGLE